MYRWWNLQTFLKFWEGYFRYRWSNTRLVCTHLNALLMLNPNIVSLNFYFLFILNPPPLFFFIFSKSWNNLTHHLRWICSVEKAAWRSDTFWRCLEWAIPENFCPPSIELVGFPVSLDKIDPRISRLILTKIYVFTQISKTNALFYNETFSSVWISRKK